MYFQKRLSPVSYHREGHVAFSRQNAKPEPEVHVEHGGETARLQRLSKELEPDDWVPGLATRRVIGHLRNDCQNEEARTKLTKLEKRMSVGTILLIILVLVLLGAIPTWGHSRAWGYGPSGIVGVILVVVSS
jgi:hypothetical protein